MSRIRTARKELLDSKSLVTSDCQDLRNAIWPQDEDIPFFMTAFSDVIANASLKAAEPSSDSHADLWKCTSAETYTSKQIQYGSLTISASIREPGLRFVAAAPHYGTMIDFPIDAFLDAACANIAATLIHGAFHLIGFADSDLREAEMFELKMGDKCVR